MSGQTKSGAFSEKHSVTWKIRAMVSADIREVAALESENFSEPWSEKGFADALTQPRNIFLVAETGDGQIGAYCGLYVASDEGEITNVAVAEKLRRHGIGLTIVKELLKQAAVKGVSKIYLEVRKSNETARRLYGRAGFSDCGVRKNFYQKPKEDAYVMCAKTERGF